MAMSKQTANTIAAAREVFGNREFTENEWEGAHMATRLDTVVYHGGARRIEHVEREYYTVEEIVNELNGCAGDDCYACNWHYEIDSNGKIFQDFKTYTYQMT